MADLLADPNCKPFIESLLNEAAGLYPFDNPPASTDVMALFNRVASQGGFSYEPRYLNGQQINTIGGQLKDGDATVYLVRNPQPNHSAAINRAFEARSTIHELLHHAGDNYVYSDRLLAEAVFSITGGGAGRLPAEGDVTANSRYWNSALANNCVPSYNRR